MKNQTMEKTQVLKKQATEEDWVNFVQKCNLFFGTRFQTGFKPMGRDDSAVEFKEKKQKIYAVVNTTLLETTPPDVFWEFCLRDFGVELSLLPDSPWPDAVHNVGRIRLGLHLLEPSLSAACN